MTREVNISNQFALGVPADDHELAACLDIVSQSLHFQRDLADRFAQIVGRENFRILRRNGGAASSSVILGGLALHEMGQFFGGRSVKMVGVGAVGIAPEHRAGGAATAMMTLAVREMHQRGVPISVLYPATVPLYRRAGYELAGSRYEITIPIRLIPLRADDGSSMRIERIDEERDRAQVQSLYLKYARNTPGLLERGKFSWLRAREPRGEKAIGYKAVTAHGKIEGYAYLLQKDAPPGQGTLFNLNIADLQLATADAGRALLRLLHQHRSVCDSAVLFASPDHPLLALMPERTFAAKHQFHWMLRIVDMPVALAQRGWNRSVRGEVHLDVLDDVLPANNGRSVLRVEQGKAQVQPGGRGEVRIDIRGLAALYTGHLSPHDLLVLGLVRMSDDAVDSSAALETLGAMFAGPRPWLSDMF